MGGGNLANPNKKRGFAISGILYPLLILTLFLVVQMLFMLQTRKNVLDKARTELADSINSSNQVYNNEELSTIVQEQSKLISEQQTKLNTLSGNVYSKNDTYNKDEINNIASKINTGYEKTIDLTSGYDVNTWYPVKSTLRYGYQRVRCVVSLEGSGKPTWATHASGFSVSVDLMSQGGGWGTQPSRTIVLANDYLYAAVSPVGYKNYGEISSSVFYLRGGGRYKLYTESQIEWTIYKTKTVFNSEYNFYVEPHTSNPGITATGSVVTIK